ncbi:uncharacterized protein LOC135335130 [Halichondria panicea]|uniref:uncharacterized protein LOC135335130 n=1 Tax=Halichondria panicea TaxID=6063 RepID=UPI00312B2F1D
MSSQPCLSVMHAKAHSWHCQVLWGGRWQPNSAAGAGEEMEQLFSYLSRFNLTTKYMNAAGREEQLTEAAMFWNDRKISSLPSYLKCRLNKTRRDLGELKKELLLLQDKVSKDLTPEYCEQCRQEVQEIARRECSGGDIIDCEQQRVDYFQLKMSNDTAIQLQPLVRERI